MAIAIGAFREGAVHSHTRRALEAGCTPDELGHSCSSFEGADKVDQLTCLEPGFSHVLREELDPRWAARPIAMARHWDRTLLMLEDAAVCHSIGCSVNH